MRPPRPYMTHFELPENLFSDLSLPTPAPENLTEEKGILSVKVYRSSVLLSPFRCSQVLHEHSMFRREVTMGTLCKEAVREEQGTVTHRTEREQIQVMGCWPGHGITGGMEQHTPQGSQHRPQTQNCSSCPCRALPGQGNQLPPRSLSLFLSLLASRSSPCASQSLLLPTTCCLRQCALVIKQSSWVRVTNKCHSKQERLS